MFRNYISNLEKAAIISQNIIVGSWTAEPLNNVEILEPTYGLYLLKFNEDLSLRMERSLSLSNPSWVEVHDDHLFVTNEDVDGAVTSLSISDASDISFLNSVSSGGSEPAHLLSTFDHKFLVVCNYSVDARNAGFSVISINNDFSLGQTQQYVQFKSGSNVNLQRQLTGHAHHACTSKDGKYLWICDLGADKVYAYRYAASRDKPFVELPANHIYLKPGSGPRHMVHSKDGKYAYVITEMSCEIYIYSINEEALNLLDVFPLDNGGIKGKVGSGSSIVASRCGSFIYASNRGDVNSISVFKINIQNGSLTLVESFPSGGLEPRAINFDKSGNLLFVTNTFSDCITVFLINKTTGCLIQKIDEISIHRPTDVKFY